jgi:hypothetical protein
MSPRAPSLLLFLVFGCSSPLTSRYVDTPAGKTVAFGAPQNTTYEVEAQPEHELLRLNLYEVSSCASIPVDLVDRREEMLRGDEVVEVKQLGKVQIAKPAETTVPCQPGYARDVEVSLVVSGATYPLGKTDASGYVGVNLSRVFDRGIRSDQLPDKAQLQVRAPRGGRTQPAGWLDLGQLKRHEAGFGALVAEFNALLDKGTALNPEEIRRSYVLYEQLRALSYYDPRFRGSAARFWELVQGRKQDEASTRLARNLQALAGAKELLKSAGIAAIPVYAQIAANSGSVDDRSVEWANWELLVALRNNPAPCAGGFSWSEFGSGYPVTTQFAAEYLRFSQGDGFSSVVNHFCAQITR